MIFHLMGDRLLSRSLELNTLCMLIECSLNAIRQFDCDLKTA